MPTETDGEPRSPWGAPTDPRVETYQAPDPRWAEALPDPAVDPDPTGELPVVSPALPTPIRYRRSRQRAAVVGALIVPAALFVTGLVLILFGVGVLGGDGDDPVRQSAPPDTLAPGVPAVEPPLATAAVVVDGDPAVAATDLAGVFVTQMKEGAFDAASGLTGGALEPGQLRAGYGAVGALDWAVARVAPIGPDTYAVRIVLMTRPADPTELAVGRCEQWTVSPSARRVIPGEQLIAIEDPEFGSLRGPELAAFMAGRCAAASFDGDGVTVWPSAG